MLPAWVTGSRKGEDPFALQKTKLPAAVEMAGHLSLHVGDFEAQTRPQLPEKPMRNHFGAVVNRHRPGLTFQSSQITRKAPSEPLVQGQPGWLAQGIKTVKHRNPDNLNDQSTYRFDASTNPYPNS